MKNLTIEKRRAWTGFVFILPWVIGLLLFFIYPLIQTINYSFHDVSFLAEGGLNIQPLQGHILEHYLFAFTKDPDFLQHFWASVQKMLLTSPCVVVFSLFIALILNQKFIGRTFMRAMFFLPVIVATGMITSIIKQSLTDIARGGSADSNLFNSIVLAQFLIESGFPEALVNMISGLINNIIDLVWQSGIQILIFLAGLLSISPTYYEVAEVEGATKWEGFWKITLPMVSPYILVNLIYTIIDSFTSYDNQVMRYIVDVNYKNVNFSYGSALYWLYFLTVILFILIIYLLLNKRIYYDVS